MAVQTNVGPVSPSKKVKERVGFVVVVDVCW